MCIRDSGYLALRFDMRGCGESEGERGRVICLEQVADTKSAFDFLAQTEYANAQRIAVFGHSFGAAVAVYAAGTDARIAACISSGGWGHCLLYTSDAADERSSVDLGGRRIIKKKK